MNGVARFCFAVAATGMQCVFGVASAASVSLDEYLYPVALPPEIPARFVYQINLANIYEKGSGYLGAKADIYSTRSRYFVVGTSVPGGSKEVQRLGYSIFIDYEPRGLFFENGVTDSAMGYFDCFFPRIPLSDVKPKEFPSIITVDSIFMCLAGTLPAGPKYTYTARYEAPTVAAVEDGNLIEAVRVVVKRDGYAWGDYLFGYHLGLIRFDAAEATKTFFSVPQMAVTSLPPPAVEGTVVEYRNTQDFPQAPGGHFFYSSDPAERAGVDAGQAGKFERTGRSFNAGGYVPVCRFYGSISPGPNSHFFSASPEECALLKSLLNNQIASNEPRWNSEGNGFYTVAPVSNAQGQKTCLTGTQPVYRAYNNAFPASGKRNPWDSNHRFSMQRSDIDDMVQRYGWRDEGLVFCVPLAPGSQGEPAAGDFRRPVGS